MSKKFLALALCFTMLFSLVNVASAEDAITWEYNSNTKVLTIKGSGKMTSAPWNNEIDVTEVEKIVIEDGITSICDNAFCVFEEDAPFTPYENLQKVEIPESVTEIGVRAFGWAGKLTSVQLPSKLKKLGMLAFSGTGITDLTIPATLTQWDRTTFANCFSLENVTISDGLTKIPDFTLYGCESLTQIVIPDSVVSIGEYAFGYCTSLETVVIPYGVVTIGEYAFTDCESLAEISIPSSIKKLYGCALENYYTETIYYQGTKADWDKIEKSEYVMAFETELVFKNSEALNFKVKIEGEQVTFSWDEVSSVLSYGLAVFKDDEYVTGTQINENFKNMSFTCTLEDGKYYARLMLLTADFSGSSEFLYFNVGDGVLSESYALTTLKGEMIDGRFYAEAEIVERFDRSAMDMYIIAVYKDGAMLDMVYVSGDLIPGTPFKFGGMLEGEEGAELKAFVWDSIEGMQTLSNVVEK